MNATTLSPGTHAAAAPPKAQEPECPECRALLAQRIRGGPYGPFQSVCKTCQDRKMRVRVFRYKNAERVKVQAGRLPRNWHTLVEVAQIMNLTPSEVITLQGRAMRQLRAYLYFGPDAMYEVCIEEWIVAIELCLDEGLVEEAVQIRLMVEQFRELVFAESAAVARIAQNGGLQDSETVT